MNVCSLHNFSYIWTCIFKFILSRLGMLMSVAFIIATIIVYATLPTLRTFRIKLFLCYLISMAVFFVSCSLIHLNGTWIQALAVCKTVAYIAYFAFLSAATWASVISFDARNILYDGRIGKTPAKKGTMEFVVSMVYAWGLPALLSAIGYALDSSESVPDIIQPGFATQGCFLKGTEKDWNSLKVPDKIDFTFYFQKALYRGFYTTFCHFLSFSR